MAVGAHVTRDAEEQVVQMAMVASADRRLIGGSRLRRAAADAAAEGGELERILQSDAPADIFGAAVLA